MAKVKDQLGQLGMGTLVAGMKALESTRVQEAVQAAHRHRGGAAAHHASRLRGWKGAPAGKEDRGCQAVEEDAGEGGQGGVKETLGTAAAAAASGAALKVASKVGRKLTERVSEAVGAGASSGTASRRDDNNSDRLDEDSER